MKVQADCHLKPPAEGYIAETWRNVKISRQIIKYIYLLLRYELTKLMWHFHTQSQNSLLFPRNPWLAFVLCSLNHYRLPKIQFFRLFQIFSKYLSLSGERPQAIFFFFQILRIERNVDVENMNFSGHKNTYVYTVVCISERQ